MVPGPGNPSAQAPVLVGEQTVSKQMLSFPEANALKSGEGKSEAGRGWLPWEQLEGPLGDDM